MFNMNIIQVSDSSDRDSDTDFSGIFEVFSTEKRRWDAATVKPTRGPTALPSASAPGPPYKYFSDAEDPALMAAVMKMFWESHLHEVTSVHMLAASPGLCKVVVDATCTKRIESTLVTEVSLPPSEVPPSLDTKEVFAARQAAFSLPLCEIELTLNDFVTDSAILDQGSQITAIRTDVAHACSVCINTNHRIEMEGANGDKSWMLGCAEDLLITIGNLSFTMHAHIVPTESAPFHLILG